MSATPAASTVDRFDTLERIQDEHVKLLRRIADQGPESTSRGTAFVPSGAGASRSQPTLDEIETFVRRTQAAGSVIGASQERWAAQGLMDYWAAELSRSGRR